MMWSKLKLRIEDGFADSVKGRVEVWATRYRASHDQEGEGWITLDKQRVHSMGSLTYFAQRHVRKWQMVDGGELSLYEAYAAADRELAAEGVISLPNFRAALLNYLNLSMDDVLVSDQAIIRAIGMLDKRLGKRRLLTLDLEAEEELVKSFYKIRCALEGIHPVGRVSV